MENSLSCIEEQKGYIRLIKDKLFSLYNEPPKAHIITYGCQQNVSDSQRIKGMLIDMGYSLTENPEEAHFILFNTCAVRAHAEARVFGNVGATKKYKRARPNMLIAVCGCMAQQEENAQKLIKSYPYVDLIFGTQVSHRLPEFIYKRLSGGKRIKELALENKEIVEGIPVFREGDIKGFVPIMWGCDNFCSYCIVPYVRGRERSRKSQEIIKEIREMIASGYKEIMLLGQNVNSYGKDLDEDINFSQLLRRINALEGDFIIRFMTSHPKDCTEELIETIRDCEKIERHLHLPFQSGSDRILKLMNRRYTRESYLALIKKAKKEIPQVSFTSDIIVGFPGETEDDFKETLSLIEEVGFSSLFTFIYSPRRGTPAAAMEDPISRKEKGVWFSKLLRKQEQIEEDLRKTHIGKVYKVLFEELSPKTGKLIGKTSNGISIEVEENEELLGSFCEVKIIKYENAFIGEIIK